MTDANRHADPANWDELLKAAVARELDARSRRGRSILRSAAVAAVAFGMGALAATAVLAIQGHASKAPVLVVGSPAPRPVEAAAKPLQAPQARDVASESVSEGEPGAVAVGPDGAVSSRPIRDVLVQPNVDPSALPQERKPFAERVHPAPEAPQADERAAPGEAPEPWTADRQDARMAGRDAPAEVPAPGQAEPSSTVAPALATASREPALARVRSAVSMRSAPDRGSEVVGVVPADGSVQVVSCDGWCEVVYEGRRGFIYRTFLDGVS